MQFDTTLNCYEKAALERPMYAEAYCKGIHEVHMLELVTCEEKMADVIFAVGDNRIIFSNSSVPISAEGKSPLTFFSAMFFNND
ncbi:hypothetical protein L1987_18594 [Smallanthus sonchifolius]|uniref:Uncharacterized protein n=1 Tax=Smallanthus sonchifolius TaxID=185202 RepID=A0ACB9J107_9ASTR|nr:hypothetical protein L1987_18594 [Smallanthus sonchifolius]